MDIINEWVLYIDKHLDMFVFYLTIGAAVLLLVNIFQIALLVRLKRFYKKFGKGKGNVDIATVLADMDTRIGEIIQMNDDQDKRMNVIVEEVKKSVDKVIVHKYDAFENMNGETSSVILLLDRSNTGILINVIHNREGSYTYTKKITEGKAAVTLSKEEKAALESIDK